MSLYLADAIARSGNVYSLVTVFEQVGGTPFFDKLVADFYKGVDKDPILRPMYPDDLTSSIEHLSLFLQQYWGGPPAYIQERGHPRLRWRHSPFEIGEQEARAWLVHMTSAVADQDLPEELEAEMLDYFKMAARSLINSI